MRSLLVASLVVALLPAIARADEAPPPRELVVGVSHGPPGVIRGDDKAWTGICIDAWKAIARELGVAYRLQEVDPKKVMADGPTSLGVDVVACIPINPRTEAKMDVSHPFTIGFVGIATRFEASSGVERVARKLLDWRFLRGLGLLLLVIVVVGVVVWRIEHKSDPAEFGGTPLKGIGGGIFWTVESLFAKPKPLSRTLRSRLVALFWVIVCMVIVSGITARLAAEFTVNELTSTVNGPKDLPRARVGVSIAAPNAKTAVTIYLDRHGIPYRTFVSDTSNLALDALDRGELDAVVGDAVVMKYEAITSHGGRITVLPSSLAPKPMGFGLVPGSPLRKRIDTTIVALIEQEEFAAIAARYVGAID